MTLEKDDPHIELTGEQLAKLKQAISDLAEAKRVPVDKLSASEFIGADHDPSASRNDIDHSPPPSQQLPWWNRWPLASGIVGIVLGFLLSALLT